MIEDKCAKCGKRIVLRQGARVTDLRGKERILVDTRKRGAKYYCIDHLPKRGE